MEQAPAPPAVELRNISKVFGSNRALEKQPAISYAKAIGPNRIITPGNAAEVLQTGGWGTSWVNGFRELLGLPDLSGSALTSASTLNGAMVGSA